MLLHGAGMNSAAWLLQTRFLARVLAGRGLGVVALDMPGHGRSAGPMLGTIEDMAAWVLDCMIALGLGQAALVGHSMGALVALEAAAMRPEAVHGLALLGVAPEMPVHPALLEAARGNPRRAAQMVNGWGFGRPAHRLAGPGGGVWLAGLGAAILAAEDAGALYNDLKACADYKGGARAAARVACPAHLILGARDMMTPAKRGCVLAEMISGAQVHRLDCGHMIMASAARSVNELLATHLAL